MPKGVYERTEAHLASARRGLAVARSPENRIKARKTIRENDIRTGTKPGTKFSNEHREALSKAHKGKTPGNFGKFHTEEAKEKNRQAHLGIKVSEDTRRKMRIAQQKRWAEGRGHENFYKGGQRYKNYWMKSGTEVRVAQIFDNLKIKYEYEPQRFRLSWCTYKPDFWLPEFGLWVEVKGWMDEKSESKIQSFRKELGKTLVVVMYEEVNNIFFDLSLTKKAGE